MADEYVVFGNDTPARTVTDVGDAKVLDTTKGTGTSYKEYRGWAARNDARRPTGSKPQ